MKHPHTGSVRWVLANGLPGLDAHTELDIRVLPKETLYGLVNRFVRFEFPAVRDYEATLQLVSKGVLSPAASGKNVSQIPYPTLEKLALAVVSVSLGLVPEAIEQVNPNDRLLTLAYTLESLQQFDAEAICSEDRALINQHAAPSSWGGEPALDMRPTTLKTLLWELGYPTHWLEDPLTQYSGPAAYWLNRKEAMGFPWRKLLDDMPQHLALAYPRLSRLKALSEVVCLAPPLLGDSEETLGAVLGWLQREGYDADRVRPPYQQVILVEGSTEAILLPVLLAAVLGDSIAQGIRVTPVGGKNQMLEHYVTLSEQLTLPLGVLLDRDAKAMEADLLYYKRPQDRVVILDEGEFEDLYTPEALRDIINTHYQPFEPVHVSDLELLPGQSRSRQLAWLWPRLGLGGFEKVTLAHQMAGLLAQGQGVSEAMKQLVYRLAHVFEA